MEDDYDIYGDLEGFEAKVAQDDKVVHELKAQIAELRSQIAAKEHEKQETVARNTVLLENISSLLVTAKAELKRKDAMIADIRRDRDNAAFRRTKPVHKLDKGTQTTLIRLLSTRVQTAEWDAPRVKKDKEVDWRRERSRVEEDHRRDRERFRGKERVSVRERLGIRGMVRSEVKQVRGERRGRGDRMHEEEREREWQARHGPRSPDSERMRSAVRFRSPVRVKAEDSSVPDSASDIELSRAFIPMNRKELDRYVKEIGRDQNRSPVVTEVTKQDKTSKPLDDVTDAELWDTRRRKKTKTPKKHRKLARKTPIKKKSPKIIQSDEIGTTACGNSSLSPVKSEDIEQRMSALHGHPPLPEPPELTIPPPEPPIIEHVPELPLEDDAKLNDSRELKIIESSDEQQQQQEEMTQDRPELVVDDEPNSSAETVIERSRVEDEEDLEEGEIVTPASSPVPPSKAEIAEAKRNAKIAKAVAQLAQETETNSVQESSHAQSNHPTKEEKSTKPKRKRTVEEPKIPPPKDNPTPEQDKTIKPQHKRNLSGAFQLPTPPEQSQQQRRNTFSGGSVPVKRRHRLSEPGEKGHKRKSETLQELFGPEDDDSKEEVSRAKRKRTESAGEALLMLLDSKKRKSEDEVTKKGEVDGEVAKEEVPRNENELVAEVEVIQLDRKELEAKNESTTETEKIIISENAEESNVVTPNDPIPDELEAALSDENKNVLESESVAEVANEVPPQSEEVPPEEVANHEENVQIDDSRKEEEATTQEIPSNVDVQPPEGTHPHEVIVVSNKYCEYRIEEDNEAEITFYVTRKKKKKSKSKSRNASLNASGAP